MCNSIDAKTAFAETGCARACVYTPISHTSTYLLVCTQTIYKTDSSLDENGVAMKKVLSKKCLLYIF